MRTKTMSIKKLSVKKSKAYKSLSPEAKLLYEYCLEMGSGEKEFGINYDEFTLWLNKRKNNETLLRKF